MKKKALLLLSAALSAAMLFGAAALNVSASVSGYSDFIREDFNSGTLSDSVWETPTGDMELVNVEPTLNYQIYHTHSVSTKEEVTVADTDVLVVEYDLQSIDVEGGFWGVTYGEDSTELSLTNAICFYGTSQIFFGGKEDTRVYNADLTSQRWIAWSRDAVTRIEIYPDGAQKMYQDGTLIAQVQAKDADDAQKERNGYLGIAFSGSGNDASVTSVMGYFKVGHAPVPSGSDPVADNAIVWDIDDSAPTAAGLNENFVTNQINQPNQPDLQGWILSAAYLKAGAEGGTLYSKNAIGERDGRISNSVSLTASLNAVQLAQSTAKFVFGIGSDNNLTGDSTIAVGIAPKESKYYLTVWEGTEVLAEQEVALANASIAISFGSGGVTAQYNGATVSAQPDNLPEGKFAFTVSAGAEEVRMDDLVIRVADSYVQNEAGSAALSFDGYDSIDDIDSAVWYVGSMSSPSYEGGGLRITDGALSFYNASDGSMLTSQEKFQNFVLQFDVVYLEREGQEDAEGNLLRNISTWIGITFGMDNADSVFHDQSMIYMGPGTIDLLNAQYDDGSTRVWAPQDLWASNMIGKGFTVRVEARDNRLTLAYCVDGEDESVLDTPKAVISEIDTFGHVGIQCTDGGNFDIDNLILINTDEVENYELTEKESPVTQITAAEGQTVTGSIDLGDMTNKTAVFTPVEQNGFKLNADGTYEYTAPAEAADIPSISYTVTIDDWCLDGWYSPVGSASEYTLTGSVQITVTEVTLSEITVTPPTKTEYTVGEELDLSGMTVSAVMSDGSKQTLASTDYTVDQSAFKSDTAGTYTISVSYEGKTDTFTVTVTEVTLSEITVTPPTKTEYTVGEELDLSGMTVSAVMSDGSKQTLASTDYTVDQSAFKSDTAGTYTISVSYEGKTDTFTVTVAAAPAETGCGASVAAAGIAGVAAAVLLVSAAFLIRRRERKD